MYVVPCRPGFESRQDVRFLRETLQCCCVYNYLKCIICGLKSRKKALATKIYLKDFFIRCALGDFSEHFGCPKTFLVTLLAVYDMWTHIYVDTKSTYSTGVDVMITIFWDFLQFRRKYFKNHNIGPWLSTPQSTKITKLGTQQPFPMLLPTELMGREIESKRRVKF
jgi:hypothetical protein